MQRDIRRDQTRPSRSHSLRLAAKISPSRPVRSNSLRIDAQAAAKRKQLRRSLDANRERQIDHEKIRQKIKDEQPIRSTDYISKSFDKIRTILGKIQHNSPKS